MSGNKLGGIKTAATNKAKYGDGFYSRIGAIGGSRGHTGGTYGNSEWAAKIGALGGRASKRTKWTEEQRARYIETANRKRIKPSLWAKIKERLS